MDDGEAPDGNDPEMGDDVAMESQTKRSGKLDWFGCGVGLHSAENNRRCGVEGWPGRQRGSVSLRSAKQRRWTPEAGASGPSCAGGRRRDIEEECRPLDVNPMPSLGFDLCIFIFCESALASTYCPTCQLVHLFLVHLVGWVKQ